MTLKEVNELLFPFYKFGKQCHAEALHENGTVRVASLYEFRDSKYTGTIIDETEGIIEITGIADSYDVMAEILRPIDEKYSTHRWLIRQIEINDEDNVIKYKIKMEICDLYIFCSSIKLISETLIESLDNGYTHATMLIDKLEFFQEISQNMDTPFIGSFECDYNGITFDEENNKNDKTLNFLANPFTIAVQKPTEYSKQSEVRAIWHKPKVRVKPSIQTLSKNFRTKLVDLTGINLKHFKDIQNNGIYLEIRFKIPEGDDKYVEIYRPFEMFHIGVRDDEFVIVNVSKDSIVRDIVHLDLNVTSWGFYLTSVKVSEVSEIQISTKQDESDFLVNTDTLRMIKK